MYITRFTFTTINATITIYNETTSSTNTIISIQIDSTCTRYWSSNIQQQPKAASTSLAHSMHILLLTIFNKRRFVWLFVWLKTFVLKKRHWSFKMYFHGTVVWRGNLPENETVEGNNNAPQKRERIKHTFDVQTFTLMSNLTALV